MIDIVEKNDSFLWDDIHETLWKSHAPNREKGIIMSFPSLSGDKLKEKIEAGNGKLFLALEKDKIVGTAAYIIVKSIYWFCQEKYFYLCLASVIPEYNGKGIYKMLDIHRQMEREKLGIPIAVFETHINNQRVISIHTKNGFKKVVYKACKDHNNVIMAKWYGNCPYTSLYIKFRYFLSFLSVKLTNAKTFLKNIR